MQGRIEQQVSIRGNELVHQPVDLMQQRRIGPPWATDQIISSGNTEIEKYPAVQITEASDDR